MTTKIYFKNVLCLLSFQIHNVFENNRQTWLINLHYKPDDNVLGKMWNCDNPVTNVFVNFVITIQPKTVSNFCLFNQT